MCKPALSPWTFYILDEKQRNRGFVICSWYSTATSRNFSHAALREKRLASVAAAKRYSVSRGILQMMRSNLMDKSIQLRSTLSTDALSF
jgi:hypothetical protein